MSEGCDLYVKDEGSWRKVISPYIKKDGVWLEIDELYSKANGNWDLLFVSGGAGWRMLFGAGTAGADRVYTSQRKGTPLNLLSDGNLVSAVNSLPQGSSFRLCTLFRITPDGEVVWQRTADPTGTTSYLDKTTETVLVDSNDNIYQLGDALIPNGNNSNHNTWVQSVDQDGVYRFDSTESMSLYGGMTNGFGGGQSFHGGMITDAVFIDTNETLLQIEGAIAYSFGYPTQQFMTACSTVSAQTGVTTSSRFMGSSGGTGNANGHNYGIKICKLGDWVYVHTDNGAGHKCSSPNAPCYNIVAIYRRSTNGETIGPGGFGIAMQNGAGPYTAFPFPWYFPGFVFTNGDETDPYPIMSIAATTGNDTTTPLPRSRQYFWWWDAALTNIGRGFYVTSADFNFYSGNPSSAVWDGDHVYVVCGHNESRCTIVKFHATTGQLLNENILTVVNGNDRIATSTDGQISMIVGDEFIYLQSETDRTDQTGVSHENQVVLFKFPKDMDKGHGIYGEYQYVPRSQLSGNPTQVVSTNINPLSGSNVNWGGPGGSYYWPIPTTMTNASQVENTTPTVGIVTHSLEKQTKL